MDRIVYVGQDDNIFTVNPDGSDPRRLTGQISAGAAGGIMGRPDATEHVIHAWPTWSPQGDRIAVSRVTLQGDFPVVSLHYIDTASGSLTQLYANEAGASPVIAESVPHYLYWSPDGRTLAFIASTPMALSLFLDREEGQELVSNEGPLYFTWARDSESMFIHAGDRLVRADAPFNAPPVELAPMDRVFRAPGLSPSGRWGAYVASVDAGYSVLLGDPAAGQPFTPLLEIDRDGALTWSPTEELLGVVDGAAEGAPGYGRLRLVSPGGGEPVTLVEEPMVAFFWSPDGRTIAYVAIDLEARTLVWKAVAAAGGEPRELARFVPSRDTLTMMTFFDQYAHSHSVWSPDSSRLVFSGRVGPPAQPDSNGAAPAGPSVYTLNVTDGEPPRRIAGGALAFWSWN